jgi:transcriptional antiterminator RfaH
MAATDKNWYLVFTKPRQERVARTNLLRQGYETYLPLTRELRRHHGRRMTLIVPMFPRYLFVRLDTETDNWAPIRSTLGVVSLVRFGPQPARVPDDLIGLLRAREDREGLQVLPPEAFRPGARVRVKAGGLAGYEGIFLARTGRERVLILLDILGRDTRASVAVRDLEPVS